jgi:lipoprotein-anchoring transpeptidase ErfK/SrfK
VDEHEAAKEYGNAQDADPGSPPGRMISVAGRRVRMLTALVGVGLLVLVGGAVGVYAYDAAHEDQIADGVEVGGVDVGGLDREQAERRLRKRLVPRLMQPVKVRLGNARYALRARQARLRADVDAMVDEAIEASGSWGPPGRVFRDLTGGSVDQNIEPELSYSRGAVNRFVQHVTDEVNRPARDASISPTGTSLNVVPAENGRELKEGKLRASLITALDNGGRNKLVNAHVVIDKPEVSTGEVAQKYPVYVTVDRATFTARLWKNLKLVRTYTIAVGQPAYPTPSGLFSISDKAVNPVWSVPNSPWAGELAGTTVAGGTAENPLRARWLGVTTGVGFHGTDETYSLGTAASHGCLRMSVPDVVEFYDQVPVGVPVYIA